MRSFSQLFAPVALAVVGLFATGCGGCSDSYAQCDANGNNCQVCDAYGCTDADDTHKPGTTSSGNTGAGGGSTTGSGGAGGSGGAACDPEVTTCACTGDEQCTEAGTQCIDGLCIAGCEFSYQCGAGKVCANGKCTDGCDDQTPCDAGYACDKGVCVPDPANPQCGPGVDCPTAGDVCVDGLCKTPCATNAECDAGEICDSNSGECIDDPSPKAGCDATTPCMGVGQECKDDGYCHYPCGDVNQCKLIENRFVACDVGICKTEEEVNPECTLQNPCPAGQDCISNQCL